MRRVAPGDIINAVRALRVLEQRRRAISNRTKVAIADALRDATSAPALADAASDAHAALDAEGKRALSREGALVPACSAGCSYCCHVHVDATVPEVLAIAEHLARTRTPEALQQLRNLLEDHASAVERLTDEERWGARIPCALLGSDGRCSIYEVRPLRCRAFHSSSAETCRAAFEGNIEVEPVTVPLLDQALDAAEEGYHQALIEAGLTAEGYRLEIALLIALAAPNAGEAWRRGGRAFARARSPVR